MTMGSAMEQLLGLAANSHVQRVGLNAQLESPGAAAAPAALIPGVQMPARLPENWQWSQDVEGPDSATGKPWAPPIRSAPYGVEYGSQGWTYTREPVGEPSAQAEAPDMPKSQRQAIAGKEAKQYSNRDMLHLIDGWLSNNANSPTDFDLNPPESAVSNDTMNRLNMLVQRNNQLVDTENKLDEAYKSGKMRTAQYNHLMDWLQPSQDSYNREMRVVHGLIVKDLKEAARRLQGKFSL